VSAKKDYSVCAALVRARVIEGSQVLENIKELVFAAGGSRSDVTTTVYLTDLANCGMNEVYREYFAEAPPASATVKVELFGPRLLVKIDAVAVLS
jgi:enamine deaminase RidA (YjgF/YER057c/UK114 family)